MYYITKAQPTDYQKIPLINTTFQLSQNSMIGNCSQAAEVCRKTQYTVQRQLLKAYKQRIIQSTVRENSRIVRGYSSGGLESELQNILQVNKPEQSTKPGCVYLVGTGPGDPGLLTLRAVQAIQSADVVLYDRLVSSDILSLVKCDAVMVYVGKKQGYHTCRQEDIQHKLAQYASDGQQVVRLKGGDPYIFGRGGEELLHLRQQGIPTYCIPGITAAAGIAADLGIPLTHRGVATSVRYLTGHSRDGGEELLDETIQLSADCGTTLVVYMGLRTFGSLANKLIDAGLPRDTPVVAVERGTTPRQRCVYGKLEAVPELVKVAELVSPTLLVIGKVVGLSAGWEAAQQGEFVQEGLQGGEWWSGVGGLLEDSLEVVNSRGMEWGEKVKEGM